MGRHFLFGLSLLLASMHPLCATLLVYEPFGYTPGSAIDLQGSGTGFGSDKWSAGSNLVAVTAGSLSNGDQFTAGNSLSMDRLRGDNAATRAFPTLDMTNATRTWVSYLFRLDNPLPPSLSGGDSATLTLFASALRLVEVGVFTNSDGKLVFGIHTLYGMGTKQTLYSNVVFEAEVTYSVVLSIDWGPGEALETIRLYLNPTSEPVDSSAILTAQSQLSRPSGGNQQLASLEIIGSNSAWEWQFDEIRIGSEFADILPVPEPRTGALILLTIGGIAWRRFGKAV